ncbi:MAG: LytTR family DNA-binding domain-containing protein, partial [Myxococcaceae bacterium]|nr:LytTR family DNA-binding domain-containing protein [Myxococcaceae bacterium]
MSAVVRFRTLVVDDEPLAREGVRMMLASDPEVEVVGEAGNGPEAVAALEALAPDLVLLDVQMPELNGFDVLARLPPERLPAVIFSTAYDKYALKAFDVHALDYLLKPFTDERFHEALRRAKSQLRLRRVSELSARLREVLDVSVEATVPQASAGALAQRVAIKDVGRVVFLDVDEIDWVEAADYYVEIHAGGKSYLHRETMQSLEARLHPERFMRIHRSAIVNRKR